MLRKLYDWVMALAASRNANWALAAVSFAESSFFPIPPDVMLIPMVIADRKAWWRIALICTVSSVAGALLGYAIGALLYETVGRALIEFYHAGAVYDSMKANFDLYGGWGVFAGAVTFLPYKIFTIFAGSVSFSIPTFIAISVIGRGLRFFIVAGLLYWFGEPIRDFIEKRLTLVFVAFVVLLVGGFVVLALLN
jgi:membrane protein YqaA with SNARE-associated domain